jgi:hypothetical protein
MKDSLFPDFMVGAIACISVLGFYAVMRDAEVSGQARRRDAEAKWDLPRKRAERQTPEDFCRHCTGLGTCESCGPDNCRICRGTGIQPQDESLVPRLSLMWDGVR